MKKAYQIEERRAIEKFRSHLVNDPGAIQMVLPLAEIAQMLRHGVRPLLLQAQLQLLTLIIEDEVRFLTGERYARENERDVRRWGTKRAPWSSMVRRRRLFVRACGVPKAKRSWAAMNCSSVRKRCKDRCGIGSREASRCVDTVR